MIAFRRVGVSVPIPGGPDRNLLADVDLTLAERRVAIVGPNGSGKSTLLRLVNGLVAPTAGSVLVDGLDVARRAREVRARVGFLFTDPAAQLVMPTPAEDVELSLRRVVRDRAERRRRARELLAERGLADRADTSVYDLSGGERQLVALTAVLAVQPAILVADEPTTLLDLGNRNRLRAELDALPQQVLYATHDLDLARAADRVIHVAGGRVVADGEPVDVVDHYVRSVG